MKELNEQIKNGTLSGVYLLHGEEKYLIKMFEEKIRRALLSEEDEMMNLSVFSDSKTMNEMIQALDTLPFMVEKKLVLLRELNLCKPGEDHSALMKAIEENLDTTVVVITETNADKRSQLYKFASKFGKIVEFSTQSEADLIRWIRREAAQDARPLDEATAAFLVHYVGTDMNTLATEWKKLKAYAGPDKKIDSSMIKEVCAPNIEDNIFKMIDLLANQKTASAMKVYSDLLTGGETPQHILAMIIRQFRQMLRVQLLMNENRSQAEIAQAAEMNPKAVYIVMGQCRRFGEQKIMELMEQLLEMDAGCKRSELDAGDACTMIIMNCIK